MKKVTILVPDELDVVQGSSRGASATTTEVVPESMMKVLCDRSDYHQHYYFKDESRVKILSIEDLDK